MALSRRHLILLFVFIGLLSVLRAQNERPADRTLAFTVFARNRQSGLQFLAAAGGPPQEVEFFGNARSPVYRCRGGESVAFYEGAELTAWWRARTADPRNPPPQPAPVAIARVAPGIERALFLFIPAHRPAPGEPRLQVYVVDDSPRSLPPGFASVINASGREYVAKLGDRSLEIPHGIGGKVPVQGTVELRLAVQDGDGWILGGRHTFRLGEHDRASLVFFPPTSPTGIAPVIRTLIEEMPGAMKTAPSVADAGR